MFDVLVNQTSFVKKMFNYLQVYEEENAEVLTVPENIKERLDGNSVVKLIGGYDINERVLVENQDYVSTIPVQLTAPESLTSNYCLYNSQAWVQDSAKEGSTYPINSTIQRFLTLTVWSDSEFNDKIGQITAMSLYKNDTELQIVSNTIQPYSVLGTEGIFKNYLINKLIIDFSVNPRQLYFIGPKN